MRDCVTWCFRRGCLHPITHTRHSHAHSSDARVVRRPTTRRARKRRGWRDARSQLRKTSRTNPRPHGVRREFSLCSTLTRFGSLSKSKIAQTPIASENSLRRDGTLYVENRHQLTCFIYNRIRSARTRRFRVYGIRRWDTCVHGRGYTTQHKHRRTLLYHWCAHASSCGFYATCADDARTRDFRANRLTIRARVNIVRDHIRVFFGLGGQSHAKSRARTTHRNHEWISGVCCAACRLFDIQNTHTRVFSY